MRERAERRQVSEPAAAAWAGLVALEVGLHLHSTGGGGDAIGGVTRALAALAAFVAWLGAVPVAFLVFRGPRRWLAGGGLVALSMVPSAALVLSERSAARRFEANPVRAHSQRVSGLCYGLETRQLTEPDLREGWAALAGLRAGVPGVSEASDAGWLRGCAARGGGDMEALAGRVLGPEAAGPRRP